MLRGPANADAFRTKVYGARWYHDPLPGCDIAPTSDEKWPAISTVKRAWSKEFKKRHTDGNVYPLDPLRVALYVDEEIESLAKMPTDVRVSLMAGAAQRDLRRAADRGTDVHSLIEALCDDQEMLAKLDGAAATYGDVCRRMVAELAPEILFAETVMFGRELGVAGTADCIARIHGRTYLIDWKSRGEESSHGAYETEAAQLGAYASADYLVAEVDGEARRSLLPELDGLLVVSIRPDSYEVFPVDLDQAKATATELVACWKHRRAGESFGRKACGKPIILGRPVPGPQPVNVESPVPADRTEWVKARLTIIRTNEDAKGLVRRMWPDGCPGAGPWTDDQVEQLLPVLADAEALMGAPFPEHDDPAHPTGGVPPIDATPATIPPARRPDWDVVDDGVPADPVFVTALKTNIAALPKAMQDVLWTWRTEGRAADRAWDRNPTARTVAVASAAVACLAHLPAEGPGTVEDVARLLVGFVTGRPLDDGWDIGAVLGSLTVDQAGVVASLAEASATDPQVLADLTAWADELATANA